MQIETMVVGPIETNCYFVWKDGSKTCTVIDPGASGEKLAERLNALKLTPEAILLTHSHFDHIGGLKTLQAIFGAPIYVSELDASDPAGMSHGLLVYTDTYKDGDTIEAGGLQFSVLATPGHTPGSVCLVCGDTIFSGDTLFEGACGRTDFPGGSMEEMMKSLKRLGNLPGDYRILPGHGPETTLQTERTYNPYLREAQNR